MEYSSNRVTYFCDQLDTGWELLTVIHMIVFGGSMNGKPYINGVGMNGYWNATYTTSSVIGSTIYFCDRFEAWAEKYHFASYNCWGWSCLLVHISVAGMFGMTEYELYKLGYNLGSTTSVINYIHLILE